MEKEEEGLGVAGEEELSVSKKATVRGAHRAFPRTHSAQHTPAPVTQRQGCSAVANIPCQAEADIFGSIRGRAVSVPRAVSASWCNVPHPFKLKFKHLFQPTIPCPSLPDLRIFHAAPLLQP